eukprot:TRINITY_DN28872_c0_g1_i1.p1 TRINITY_DN28872_c0_g1~~TRINITY_DN28872_c0_g1_i1.p1  ORF type:complete len:331 (-),score=64.82 TRINITY_DN28872_c0_g1_i1:93-1022(-)
MRYHACHIVLISCFTLSLSANVPTVKISPDVDMPMIAFGTARTSLPACSVQQGVELWLKAGGRHIDTADDYGTQPDVGRALKASGVPREDIFLTTKIPGPIGKDAVIDKILHTALPQLGLSYIDLVLVHFPCKNMSDFPNRCGSKQREERLDTWSGLRQLREQGKIRAIGVSNFLAEQVHEIVEEFGEAPAVNQVQWHLAYHNETLLSAMKSAGTTLEAWASLAGPTSHGAPAVSLGDERLKAIASRYGASAGQIALRWETQRGVVPVTATCNPEHAREDLESFGVQLSDADLELLTAMKPASHVDVIV